MPRKFLQVALGLVCMLSSVGLASTNTSYDNPEAKLYRKLINQYNKWNPDCNIRPVADGESAIKVQHGLSLQEISGLDDQGVITMLLWENYEWKDASLAWEEEDPSIKSLRIHIDRIWHPDIAVYNLIEKEALMDPDVVVYSDGTMAYVPAVRLKVKCSVDNGEDDDDENDEGQMYKCMMKMGSWTYDGSEIDLQLRSTEMDISSYARNDRVSLISTEARRNSVVYDCCPDPYVDITYTITVRKRN